MRLRHFGAISVVTAAGVASSNGPQTKASRAAHLGGPPHFFHGFSGSRAKTMQNEERKPGRRREVEDELFLSGNPMFIAARAPHAKITDTQRGKKPRSGLLPWLMGRRVGREGRPEPWRDDCRTDLRVRMAYAEKRTVRNGASSHRSRILGRTLPTGRLSAGRQTPESTRSPICLSNKKPGEAAS